MSHIFISYATEDQDFALRLSNDLRRLGAETWLAQQSIRPGEGWVSAIERGLRGSSHMAVVLTPSAVASPWVQKEIEVAISRERRGQMQLIPLSVLPCEAPLLLQSYQWVSFRQGYEAGLQRLATVLGLSAAALRDAAPIRTAAPSWAAAPARGGGAVQARFVEMLANLAGLDPSAITPGSRMGNDLMLDELDMIELVMEVEEEWGISIPDDAYVVHPDSGLNRTVSDWVTYIRQQAGG